MNDDVRARLDSIERRQTLLRQELAGLDETLADLKQEPAQHGDLPRLPKSPRHLPFRQLRRFHPAAGPNVGGSPAAG